ncbi:MAG: GGDEF domain-containing protein, partial [Alkalibacterium gilvum]
GSVKQEKTLTQLSLIVMDLDFFKRINDTHGHQSGNEVLKELSQRLKTNLAKDNYIARFDGEEFIILLPNYSQTSAVDVAEKIRHLIGDTPFAIRESMKSSDEESISITASLGLATSTNNDTDIEELIQLADRAMYIGSKQQGRNRVTVAQKGS